MTDNTNPQAPTPSPAAQRALLRFSNEVTRRAQIIERQTLTASQCQHPTASRHHSTNGDGTYCLACHRFI